ncbi:hypothetical protein Cus16_1181 [Curtobacterium sp. ER1/6]|nr:hypothetical protein Cus16_1181 [Curtobacterium sp. ER1/6]
MRGADRLLRELGVGRPDLLDAGRDRVDQGLQVRSGDGLTGAGGGHGTAARVPEHDDERGTEGDDRELDRAEHDVVDDLPRVPDGEQVADAGVEHVLERHAGVGAAEHGRERCLRPGELAAAVRVDPTRAALVGGEAGVALDEQAEGVGRGGCGAVGHGLPRARGRSGLLLLLLVAATAAGRTARSRRGRRS